MNLNVLRTYAQTANPSTLPPSILLSHNKNTLTIFDAFPKSIFHFLILPAVVPPLTVQVLHDLKTLLNGDRDHAKEVIQAISREARNLKAMIEEEMVKRYGFKWGIWTGFHASPSMSYVLFKIFGRGA